MSYLALARKWRPRTFQELVGQDHVSRALINSLNQQRVHHAYLFTGTRGVGKTSIARLMAKALNCEQGVSAQPCLLCDACVAIEQGRFIDLIEIDAASKTGVEDTRELMDNVAYAPAAGRYKIYLIDEVHMLSQHSFNALLKTLEEPPEHVKFLLATTEVQKLPVTVLSRCLQFTLKHLTPETISSQLKHILQQEHYPFEEAALSHLSLAAKGSMRDALSLLDQAIACSSEQGLICSEIKAMLGGTQQDYALQLLEALASLDAGQVISICRQIANEGGLFTYVLDEMLHHLHQMTICQQLPQGSEFLEIPQAILALAKQYKAEDLQLFYHMGLKGIEEMQLAPSMSMGFEMVMLRMLTFKPKEKASIRKIEEIALGEKATPTNETPLIERSAIKVPVPDSRPEPENLDCAALHQGYSSAPNTCAPEALNWTSILPKLKLTGLALNAAENASISQKDGNQLILAINKGHQSLFTSQVIQRIEQAWALCFQESIRISFATKEASFVTPAQQKQIEKSAELQVASAQMQQDPILKQLQQEFSATPVKDSIALLQSDL